MSADATPKAANIDLASLENDLTEKGVEFLMSGFVDMHGVNTSLYRMCMERRMYTPIHTVH